MDYEKCSSDDGEQEKGLNAYKRAPTPPPFPKPKRRRTGMFVFRIFIDFFLLKVVSLNSSQLMCQNHL